MNKDYEILKLKAENDLLNNFWAFLKRNLARYEFIARGVKGMSVKKARTAPNVAKSGYHELLGRPKSRTRIEREAMEPFIVDIFNQNKGRYGARRISVELERKGIYASHKRVAKILSELGLYAKGCRKRYRRSKPVPTSGKTS